MSFSCKIGINLQQESQNEFSALYFKNLQVSINYKLLTFSVAIHNVLCTVCGHV